MATPQDVLGHAASQIGYTESPPGSNRTKYAAEAGHPNGQPWCATFVVAMMRRAGIKLPSESPSVYFMRIGFRLAGRQYATPQVGDVVFYSFSHVGIVEAVQADTITTIEGNTSPGAAGSQSNGGGVYRRVRSRSLVVGCGRPTYSAPPPPPPPTGATPMFEPALQIVAYLDCPTGGSWLLGKDGAIYAVGGAPYLGGANGKPYFVGRTAARLNLVDGKYQIVATSGELYGPGF